MTDLPHEAGAPDRAELIAAAHAAAGHAYAPYSNFPVGAALGFADGRIVTAANVENASYGLSLCAETNAVTQAMSQGVRGGLLAVAVVRGAGGIGAGQMLSPCGRCRQVLSELADLGGTDPLVYCGDGDEPGVRLSYLLPLAFGPASLGDAQS
jgi:cytidine deaminase